MSRRLCCVTSLLVLPLVLLPLDALACPPAPEVAATLALAEGQYVRRQYQELRTTLAPLVEPLACFEEQAALLEAFLLLGVAAHELDDLPAAEAYFLALLRVDPDYQHGDLVQVPQSSAGFLDEVRAKHDEELRALLAERLGTGGVVVETVYVTVEERHNQFWLCFMPFGVGQFQNDELEWGYTLLALQASALAVNVMGALAVELIRGSTHTFTPDEASRAQAWQIAQLSGAAAFALLYAAGVVHAISNYRDVQTTLLPPTREKPSGSDSSSWQFVPILAQDTLGVALGWRF